MKLLIFMLILHFTNSRNCSQRETCLPIRDCDSIIHEIHEASKSGDSRVRQLTIERVRQDICGRLSEQRVCCPGEGGSEDPVFLGSFVTIIHDVQGDVYAKGPNKIEIRNLQYDGQGPDAFFLAGTQSNRPNGSGDVVLPYPFAGQHFQYEDRRIPILPSFDGQTVELTLPPGVTVDNLRWLSIWCRKFKISFGHIIL
eukprot:TRINITY_DN5456_c0_g1_i2.p1 TRINITY_DN5456_c0_g1~~TRINITY_DN5456_c0_g1_i2.p1  ORF type:complete len:198 (-),score=1.66 TRINITY_DN5456_c0_g1_i2:12-605(-)